MFAPLKLYTAALRGVDDDVARRNINGNERKATLRERRLSIEIGATEPVVQYPEVGRSLNADAH